MWEIIIFLLILYFLVVFLLSRMIVPHLGFIDVKVPNSIPESMAAKIEEIRRSAGSPYEFLKLSYEFIGLKYRSGRLNIFLKLNLLFKSLNEIWQMEGYMPCTQSNFVMRIFLIKSGYFAEQDIKRQYTILNFCLHQYLRVKIRGNWSDVDVGEKQRGMPVGKHLKWFG